MDAPLLGVARADAAPQAQEELLAHLVVAALAPELPGSRLESDGSVTVFGLVQDDAGAIVRKPVEGLPSLAGAPEVEAGLFLRHWTGPGGQALATVGAYERTDAGTRNVNLLVLEGARDVDAAVDDFLRRDAMPVLLNSLPFVLNHAHPTSLVLTLALILGVAAVAGVLAAAGFTDVAALLMDTYLYFGLAPLFLGNVLYPYHTDARQGELYRGWPETYVWHGLVRAPGGAAVWQGHYLNRTGDYAEAVETRADGTHLVAHAWKRDVVGPALRVDTELTKLPGLYLKQVVARDYALRADGTQRFDARQDLTVGAYDDAVGESPGANVRMEETKEGDQVLLYAPRQQDTISLGVRTGDRYVPLLGTRTEASHRPYTDVTNQGLAVGAIESYRVTSMGYYVGDAYVPAFGADYWGERAPTDLWALTWALGGALGDQAAGDVMARAGVFVDGRFVPVAGARLDDDFVGHRYEFRSMLSAGLFRADPLDPGAPVEGEAPDGATFHPVVATTYDGAQTSLAWALANVANETAGMGTFLVAAGLMGADRGQYLPLVGLEYVPDAYQGARAAQETYRVGVFPADYAVFVPLAGLHYDGDGTTATQALGTVAGLGGTTREGAFATSQGAYVGGGFVPLTGVRYEPTGTPTHGHGYAFLLGTYDPDGAFQPLVHARVAFALPPAKIADACHARVEATHVPTGATYALTPPCLR